MSSLKLFKDNKKAVKSPSTELEMKLDNEEAEAPAKEGVDIEHLQGLVASLDADECSALLGLLQEKAKDSPVADSGDSNDNEYNDHSV